MNGDYTISWFKEGMVVGYFGFIKYEEKDYDDFLIDILQKYGLRGIMESVQKIEMKDKEFISDVDDFMSIRRKTETRNEKIIQESIIEEYQAIMNNKEYFDKEEHFSEAYSWLMTLTIEQILENYGWEEFFPQIA